MEREMYLLVSPCDRRFYTNEEDREYFSRPVKVEPCYSALVDRLLYVRDPVRDSTFPVNPVDLKPWCLLTRREQALTNTVKGEDAMMMCESCLELCSAIQTDERTGFVYCHRCLAILERERREREQEDAEREEREDERVDS